MCFLDLSKGIHNVRNFNIKYNSEKTYLLNDKMQKHLLIMLLKLILMVSMLIEFKFYPYNNDSSCVKTSSYSKQKNTRGDIQDIEGEI